ncbi:MAG: hypothetical protein CM1200mP41_20600 [Gammaproteobacteria bacterium]|nr:MAG: hypothetical protein CM1200mP41_20600 [Gammaproteobacteria bacterium]
MGELRAVSLSDKYLLDTGQVFLTGIQALVRLPMIQSRRDRAEGLNTAGYISGYRGSPLGGLDQQLVAAQSHLDSMVWYSNRPLMKILQPLPLAGPNNQVLVGMVGTTEYSRCGTGRGLVWIVLVMHCDTGILQDRHAMVACWF